MRGVSARPRKCRLGMQNFNEKHLQVIKNVRCRCKICEGSIPKSKKRQDVDAIVYSRQAEKHLQVQRKVSCRYVGPQKSICKSEYQGLADTMVAKKSICNGEYQGLADTTVAKKSSATANKPRI